ncbi:inovirus Gp2 family protein [Echinimonas agarilytica]|uniref:Inovirus Gp2 family protein n=1 Tax=Echinimonas agarilytica TaxID=1215918 RepID=A0AA41WAN2_9GAMM|nr:inovirus Gp2 family protein [Echinimonas agarilytica]MCM2680969.1 inovirus Gp2 family protein [Echinimonas agarilytica]
MNKRLKGTPSLKLHYGPYYQGLKVITSYGPLIENYLAAGKIVIDRYLSQYSRVCAIRVDLHVPEELELKSNRHITRFMGSLDAQIEADRNRKHKAGSRSYRCRPNYIWCSERENARANHFHVIILLNKDAYHTLGNYEATGNNMASRIVKAWASALGLDFDDVGGLVHFPKNPIHYVNIHSKRLAEEYNELFFRFSYFAKPKSKHYGDRRRSFDCSRTTR